MTTDLSDPSESWERLVVHGLQLLLVGLAAVGLIIAEWGVVATAVIALGVTLLPLLLRREYGYSMNPLHVLWITLAMLLHTGGAMGMYEQFQWYDEVAHTVSATVVAGIGYASFRALELHSEEIDVPAEFRAVFIVVFVLAAGLVWEVVEFSLGDLVTVYGLDDIVTDLVFNAVGAMIVALWGTGHVGGLVSFFRDRLRSA